MKQKGKNKLCTKYADIKMNICMYLSFYSGL